MVPQWIIEKKRDGKALTPDELAFFIDGYTSGQIPDYQMAALAMAILFQGMTMEETKALTQVMLDSGDRINISHLPQPKIDKHSTGGIGDKVSLILAPLVACCGVTVPMIAGRGLGITGGTLDKLESIPGYRTDLSPREFIAVLKACGCSITGQTASLVPADKKLYALRDVTGTVPSIPLITASIMSKKLAEGIDGLVMDIKCGPGAFMKTRKDAMALAQSLKAVGRALGKPTEAIVTAMDQPLGSSAGNALEVREAVMALKGWAATDLTEVTLALGIRMLHMAGVAPDARQARGMLLDAVRSGQAFQRFKEMVKRQGGDTRVLDNPSRFPAAQFQKAIIGDADGFIRQVDAETVGRACLLLGAGRTRTTDEIDHATGISDMVKIGARVRRGDTLAVVQANKRASLAEARELLKTAFVLSKKAVRAPSAIIGLV